MKKSKPSHAVYAVLFASLCASSASLATDAQDSAQHASESIVFMRTVYNGPAGSYPDIGTGLFRVNPETRNVVQLTPLEVNTYNSGGSWSPGGTSIVYVHRTEARPDRSQLFVVDRQGVSRRITSGAARHESPVWGPGAQIAFVTDFGDQKCLSAVRADGTHQRLLFCPNQADSFHTPQWSLDGKSVYFSATRLHPTYPTPFERTKIWRVDVATGVATKLFTRDYYWTGNLSISADGTHALFSYVSAEDPATLVDLTTGATTTFEGQISEAMFSPNGRRIAFVRDGLVYVMKADGTNQHRVTDAAGLTSYNLRAWSKDNCHLLFDPELDQYDEAGNYMGNRVWIVDTRTHEITKVARGAPTGTSWYEP